MESIKSVQVATAALTMAFAAATFTSCRTVTPKSADPSPTPSSTTQEALKLPRANEDYVEAIQKVRAEAGVPPLPAEGLTVRGVRYGKGELFGPKSDFLPGVYALVTDTASGQIHILSSGKKPSSGKDGLPIRLGVATPVAGSPGQYDVISQSDAFKTYRATLFDAQGKLVFSLIPPPTPSVNPTK